MFPLRRVFGVIKLPRHIRGTVGNWPGIRSVRGVALAACWPRVFGMEDVGPGVGVLCGQGRAG